jgi:hypothetical protein
MNKLLKNHRIMSNRDDSPMTGRHIHSVRIRAFASVSEGINFTEKENAHIDVCRVCRLKLVDALRNVPTTTMPKAA